MSIPARLTSAAFTALAALTLGVILGGGRVITAQTSAPRPGSFEAKLAAAKSLKCTFQQVSTATWKDGDGQATVTPATLALEFIGVNIDEGVARMVATFTKNAYAMTATSSGGNLHFMQALSAGALYTTTVFAKESRPGKFKAVHSRHEYLDVSLPGFTSRPEQYYGECEITQ